MWGPPEACQWCSTSCRALGLSYRSCGQVGTGQAHGSHRGCHWPHFAEDAEAQGGLWPAPGGPAREGPKEAWDPGSPHLRSNEPLGWIAAGLKQLGWRLRRAWGGALTAWEGSEAREAPPPFLGWQVERKLSEF